MIDQDILVPLWLFVLLIALAMAGLLDRVLVPGVRWFLRRRVNFAIDEFNTRLKLSLRPFHLTKRQVLVDRLIYDPEVIAAMRQFADEQGMPSEVAQAKVAEYAKEIVPAFNAYFYFRFVYWLSRKLARMLYRVHVGFEDNHRLEDVDPEATVAFVMNHRSNMDYILVSYLVSRQSTLSYAVGEWARVWPLQTLVKAMGAFFVRRNSGDPLYRKVLERYVCQATKEGVCQAVFIEGGLSHDGRLREPRLGFLDYMVRNYDAARDRDIVFVPVGINYDRVIEDQSLLLRSDPTAEKRSKWFAYKTLFVFWRKNTKISVRDRRKRFGYASVNFARPISLRAYAAEHAIDFQALDRDRRFAEVKTLADTLVDSIARVIPILPVPLVAAAIRAAKGQALSDHEIKSRVHDMIDAMQSRGAPIRDEERPRERTLEYALATLRHRRVIGEDHAVAADRVDLLEFYANSLAHWEG